MRTISFCKSIEQAGNALSAEELEEKLCGWVNVKDTDSLVYSFLDVVC